jgi:hypothetical protein
MITTDTSIQGEEGGGEIPPIPSLMAAEDVERARPVKPMVVGEWYSCQWCNERFQFGYTRSGKPTDPDEVLLPGVSRSNFQLCFRCLKELLLRGTTEGCQALDRAIRRKLPSGCENADFNRFGCYAPYSAHLKAVLQKVLVWTRQACDGDDPGHLYLYSIPGPHGPGNGNGKTLLAASSFLYIARRRAVLGKDLGDIRFSDCQFLSVEQLADELFAKRRRGGKGTFTSLDSGKEISFDEYVAEIGERQVLFLDDIGCRVATSMLKEVYAKIFDARIDSNLPVFVTSNYAPDELADRIGGRAASRFFRNTPPSIVEVRAPDYPTQQALSTRTGD